MKILIVDDEAYIRLLLEQTLEDLEEEGVEILTAADGEEGLAAIQAEQPRLVFLDLMMPRMSGFAVCQAVKQDPELADIHVVLLTAKGQEYDKQRGEEVGANLYLTKPFDPDAVLALAREVLGLE
jgi:two-component system alkaline phosphatase synthesis response regulator PhoP